MMKDTQRQVHFLFVFSLSLLWTPSLLIDCFFLFAASGSSYFADSLCIIPSFRVFLFDFRLLLHPTSLSLSPSSLLYPCCSRSFRFGTSLFYSLSSVFFPLVCSQCICPSLSFYSVIPSVLFPTIKEENARVCPEHLFLFSKSDHQQKEIEREKSKTILLCIILSMMSFFSFLLQLLFLPVKSFSFRRGLL